MGTRGFGLAAWDIRDGLVDEFFEFSRRILNRELGWVRMRIEVA